MKKDFKMVGALVGFIMLVYFGVWNGFFQQDEWAGLAGFFSLQGLGFGELIKEMYTPMFSQGLGHFLPWTPLVNYLRYAFFELNYPPYAILSLALHVFASFLVFLLAEKLTKDKLVATLSAVFFAIAASASQAVTWVGTSLPTQLAAIFSLGSIIFWFEWLGSSQRQKLWLSFVALVTAIGFKETALFLFVFLPLVTFLLKPKVGRKFLVLFMVMALFYALLRFGPLLAGGRGSEVVQELSLLTRTVSANLISVTFGGVAQTAFSQEPILVAADKIARVSRFSALPEKGDPAYDIFLEKELVKPFLPLVGLLIFIFLIYFFRRQPKGRRLPSIAGLLLFISAFLPLAFIPTGELSAAFLAPRGLYLPLMGAAIIFGVATESLIKRRSQLLILVLAFSTLHFIVLRNQINELTDQGAQRKGILQQIKTSYSDLPTRVIFYTESDKAYYGLPDQEKIMPFQSGFGQTLLVWYQQQEDFPKEFFQNRFLWEITAQGYKEEGGRGFGYFRSLDLLKEAVAQYNIPIETVLAFSWEDKAGRLSDISELVSRKLEITDEVRKRLEK